VTLDYAIIAIVALGVSLLVTPGVRSFALQRKIGDYPSVRKIHNRFVPRLGGIGIIAGWTAGLIAGWLLLPKAFSEPSFSLTGIAVGIILIIGLGAYDDVKGIGSFGKLIVQFLAASLVISSGLIITHLAVPFIDPIPLGVFSLPVTMLWLVGVTNAVNLLDGLDGLAVGVSAIVAAVVFCIGVVTGDLLLTVVSVSLLFAGLGFLRYNFNPASIFMGDTGSLFLGFLLACASLVVIQHPAAEMSQISLLAAVVTLSVPIVDTSVAFFRRIKKGMHPLKADKEHIHHRLMDLGLTHRQTVVAIYAITLFNGMIAFFLVTLDSLYATLLLAIVGVLIFLAIRRMGYLEEMIAERKSEPHPIQPLSVARLIDRIVLLSGDLVALVLAFLFSYWFRFHSGLVGAEGYVPLEMYVRSPALLALTVLWLLLFVLAGLYEIPWDASRIDYVFAIVKTVGLGTLVLLIATMDLSSGTMEGRITMLIYGLAVGLFAILIRMMIVGLERRYEILGFRRRHTIVVGTTTLAKEIIEEINSRPGLKYEVIGFVDRRPSRKTFLKFPVLGKPEQIPEIVKKYNVEEVLVATGYDAREEMLDIVAQCDGIMPALKVAPQAVDALSGFRTEEIIGHPLIRLHLTNLRTWQRMAKRSIDLLVSVVVLIPLLPLWLIVGMLVVIDSPGRVFFSQERVGKRGQIFNLYKFRSMIQDAEKETGPVWATEDDKRVTRVGRFIRKLRIDEVPQFINVLKGEMSLVGPRPERPYFVEQLKREVRFYSRRLLVRPGITGWAQVKHRYDRSLEDVKEKIKYDLFYLENMSLTLDLKILLRTVVVAGSGRGTH
jgi:exopolysaccharide biosynthesis polyprenyl glycosylphosphotransferase